MKKCPSCGSTMVIAVLSGVYYYACSFCDIYIPRDDFRGRFNDDR